MLIIAAAAVKRVGAGAWATPLVSARSVSKEWLPMPYPAPMSITAMMKAPTASNLGGRKGKTEKAINKSIHESINQQSNRINQQNKQKKQCTYYNENKSTHTIQNKSMNQ